MDVFYLPPTEYQKALQNTLEMPGLTSWTFGNDGFTRYRYLCGRLEIQIDGKWLVCEPRKEDSICTQ